MVPGNVDDFTGLDQAWNDFLVSSSQSPPDDDRRLAELLELAVEMVSEELGSRHTLNADRDGLDVRVRRSTSGSNEIKGEILARICNKSAMGGGLGKQVTELLDNVVSLGPHPVRAAMVRSRDYKPKTPNSAIAKTLAKLFAAGGSKVIVPDSDWRAIQAMQRFRAQNQNAPFSQWLCHAQPMSKLASLRKLLDLDRLASPDNLDSTGQSQERSPLGATRTSTATTGPTNRTSGANQESNASRSPNREAEAELAAPPLGSIQVGTTRNRKNDFVLLAKNELSRHVAFLGGTGSGKTTAALNIVEQLLYQDIPVLLVDRKGDLVTYAREQVFQQPCDNALLRERQTQLRDWVDVAVYTPGQPNGRPINLPIAPDGLGEMDTADIRMTAAQAARSLGQMLGYKESGKNASRIAVMVEAIELMAGQSYQRITLDDLIQYIDDRDDALIAAIGKLDVKLFDGLLEDLQTLKITRKLLFPADAEPLRADDLFGTNARKTRLSVISLKFLGDVANIQFWVAQLLLELSRWMGKSPSSDLRAAVLFDEADLYLPATSKPATKEPMENLLRRARSAGLGVMLATQSPGDFDYKCRDNINTWFLGRIKEATAINKMKSMLNECKRDVRSELGSQDTGEFFLVRNNEVTAIRGDRSIVETRQVPEDEILRLAQQRSAV